MHNPNIVWDEIMKTEVQCVVNNNVEYRNLPNEFKLPTRNSNFWRLIRIGFKA
jgi:hypothetical protein